MVREEDGLGALQMRVSRERDLRRLPRALQKYALQLLNPLGDRAALAPEVEPHVERDLVVATAPGVQLRADGTGDLRDASFDRGVDVLVARRKSERLAGQLLFDAVQRGNDDAAFLVVQQTDAREHLHVRARADDVVGGEATIEGQADRE